MKAGDRIRDLEESFAAARLRADTLQHALDRREVEVEALTKTVAEREGRVAALQGSLSWRLTLPLRVAAGLVLEVVERVRDGPRKAVNLNLLPSLADPRKVSPADGRSYWIAETSDPSFMTGMPPGQPAMRPGWYRARARMVQRVGRLAAPRVYCPFPSGGFAEFRSVELLPLGNDEYSAEFHVPERTAHLRFDPSIYPCEFECDGLLLEPIPGARRWLATLRGMAHMLGRLSAPQLLAWLRQGTRVLLTEGPRWFWNTAYWEIANHARRADIAYSDWVREYSTTPAAVLEEMGIAVETFARRPVVSLITPVFNTPEPFLRAMLDSVVAQVYPHWELCIADDASSDAHVRRVLEEYSARESRIKVAWRERNGHISAASNTALELATGEFIALLDHDDILPPDALYWVVGELNDHPDACLVYSDEDKLDFDGARLLPYFKCDWNYDLFLAHNLITHLGVYRRDIVRRIGGFREGFEGAQDYDLALRFIEQIEWRQIRHVPRVLYHWRMLRGSTAIGAGEKGYAAERARLAVEEHLRRMGTRASVETIAGEATQRVRLALPDPAPFVSIIVPTRNGERLVRQCVESVREKTSYPSYEIVLVDNGSDDASAVRYFRALEAEGIVRLRVDPRPFNFSRLNNEAAAEARGDYLVFLNNDVEVITPEWLSELVSHAARPGVGAVGARLWYPNDTIQHAGLVLVAGLAGHAHLGRKRGDHGYFSRASLAQTISAVTAACLCVRMQVFREVGGFDETLAVAFNDVDLCLKIQAAGYRNVYTPYAELYHHESATRGYEDTPEKMRRFQKEADVLRHRWMPVLLNDPYYSPNLTLSGEPFTLAWPPRVEPFRTGQSQ